MDIIDYYYILSISPNATLEEIRRAYRRLAFLYHPDVYKGPDSTRVMQQLNEAYSVLGNPVRRAQYDFWKRYAEQPSGKSKGSDKPKSAVPLPQIGLYQTVPFQKSSGEGFLRLWLFMGQIIYRIIINSMMILLALVLYLFAPILYFIALGLFYSYWIAPYNSIDSGEALGLTMMTAMILGWLTPRLLKRIPALKRLYRMLGYS